jgi:hypothetical protein
VAIHHHHRTSASGKKNGSSYIHCQILPSFGKPVLFCPWEIENARTTSQQVLSNQMSIEN